VDWVPVVEAAAGACAVWAVWASIPRAPALDWERLFKATLSVLSWAEAEEHLAAEGEGTSPPSVEAVEARWRAAVVSAIPFHPGGRRWHDKLSSPNPDAIDVPALPGERALVEALARLDTPAARWDRLFGQAMLDADLHGAESLGDPRALGARYDPARLLGPEAGWEGISAWSAAVRAGLGRRLSHVVVLLTGAPRVGELADQADGLRVVERSVDGLGGSAGVLALMASPSDRLVWIHGGSGSLGALQVVADSPALVDRLEGFVALGGCVSSDDNERQQLATLLHDAALVPELQRRIPLVSVSDVDPDAPTAHADGLLRFPAVDPAATDRPGVLPIDLGPLAVSRLPADQLGRAVLLTLVFLLDA